MLRRILAVGRQSRGQPRLKAGRARSDCQSIATKTAFFNKTYEDFCFSLKFLTATTDGPVVSVKNYG